MKTNQKWWVVVLTLTIAISCPGQIPRLEWARSMGSVNQDQAACLALDADGNVLITGDFSGTADFDPGDGTYNLTSEGGSDIFIQKLDPAGNLVWACRLGGENSDRGHSIATGPAGNIIVAGYFSHTVDFDPGPDAFFLTSKGFCDAFILKLDGSGQFLWAKQLGGSFIDEATSLALDALGNILVTGYYHDILEVYNGSHTFSFLADAGEDIFIIKLDPAGNLLGAGSVGGPGQNERAQDIHVDNAGNIWVAGYFEETADLNPGPGNFFLQAEGEKDAFVLKLNPEGGFIWARSVGGEGTDKALSFAVGPDEEVFLTGYFKGLVDFNPGSGVFFLGEESSQSNLFVLHLDADGNFLNAWALQPLASGNCAPSAIALGPEGNLFLTGTFYGLMDFNPGAGEYLLSGQNNDIFVLKTHTSGAFQWAKRLGDYSAFDEGHSLALNEEGGLFVTGNFSSTIDFDPGPDISDLFAVGLSDIFVFKWTEDPDATHHLVFPSPITLYPNPATDRFTLDMSAPYADVTVEITTLTGQVMQRWQGDIYHPLELEISGPPGLYFVHFSDERGREITRKIIKF